ncbi:MAG: RSP_7527 family protein [Burkholderiales bacterium]
MLEQGRYPTHEEIEAIIARARRMRAQYVGALIARGMSRLVQMLGGPRPRREIGARRLGADMG